MSIDTSISLSAQTRSERGKNAMGRMRRNGLIPVTVFGGDSDAVAASIVKKDLGTLVRAHGRHAIFTLNLENSSSTVKISEMQLDPIKGVVIHLDLQRISLTERSEFEVVLRLVGEAEGVKLGGGLLDVPMHSIKIRCLPRDLPDHFDVNVSHLGIGQNIRVSDLKLDPEMFQVVTDAEQVICNVASQRAEAVPVVEAVVAEPEVIKKGKPEEKK